MRQQQTVLAAPTTADSWCATAVPVVVLSYVFAAGLSLLLGTLVYTTHWSASPVIRTAWRQSLQCGWAGAVVAAWRPRAAPYVGLLAGLLRWTILGFRLDWGESMWRTARLVYWAPFLLILAIAPLLAVWVVRRYLDPFEPVPRQRPEPHWQRGGA